MGGYFIPANLQSKKEDIFLFSYIHRTRKNLEYVEQLAKKEREEGKKVDECSVFETTELLNSLMGFIVFPMESFLEKTIKLNNSHNNTIDKIIVDILADKKKYEYKNTYHEYDKLLRTYTSQTQVLTKYTLIKHMRDAMCHENLSIKPIPSKDKNIKWVTFADYYPSKSNPTSEFFVKLSVEEIRAIAMAICDEILDVAFWTYQMDFKKHN